MSLQSKNEFQIFSLHPVVQETIITDLLKTGWKHMHQVSPNEFCMLQSDLAPGLAGLFSPGGECDFLFRDGKDTVVGDGDFMGIPSKVFERIAKSVKSFFYVRAPVFAVKIIFELLPLIGIPEFFTGRRENDLSFPVHGIKLGKIFPFKFIPEYPDRNEKLVF